MTSCIPMFKAHTQNTFIPHVSGRNILEYDSEFYIFGGNMSFLFTVILNTYHISCSGTHVTISNRMKELLWLLMSLEWRSGAKIFQSSLAVEKGFVNESISPNPCQSERAQHVTRLHVCDMFSVPLNPSHRPTQTLWSRLKLCKRKAQNLPSSFSETLRLAF